MISAGSRGLLAALLTLSLAAVSSGQPQAAAPAEAAEVVADAGRLTLERIMADPDWIGNPPTDPYWSDDGRSVYYRRKRVGGPLTDLWRAAVDGGEPTVVSDGELAGIDVAAGRWSRDRRFKVYARHGDLFLKDLRDGTARQLTRTAAEESAPRFMAGDERISFLRGEAVFVRDLASGLELQPADLRLTKDPQAEDSEPKDFLERQQLRLFDVLRRRDEHRQTRREHRRRQQAADPSRPPLPWYLGDDVEILQQALSPAGDRLALVVIAKQRDEGKKDQMPAHVTESGYVESREVRAKVGTGDGTGQRLWLLDLASRERHEIDLSVLPGIHDDPLAEIRRASEAEDGGEAGDGETPAADETTDEEAGGGDADAGEEPEARAVRLATLEWSGDGGHLAVQATSLDHKDRWIALLAAGETALRPVHRLHSEQWINWSFNDFGWLADGRRLYFLSEESGFSQLYLYHLEDASPRRLTDGDFVVSDPQPGRRDRVLLYTANADHPGRTETYRVDLESGRSERLTDLGGRNRSLLSADGEWLLVTHSTTTRPPELYVQPARAGAEARRLTHTASEAFTALPWVEPEVVAIPSSHVDRPIYSRFYAPRNPADGRRLRGAGGGRPAVVFIHGAGYLQNAHHGWSNYFREFMFHSLLTQQGYLVLDMDYRASAGYGAAWRTAIYRQMGTPELEDLADGVRWLVDNHGVDPARVGTYGGSYGGFLTMMALFKRPDLFACGAALRPVTDWAHYNHPYTSNILNTPEADPDAYARSSPIEHAAGLARPLLICAPMQDDNVFFQDTVRLAQRLIELEKQDWEVAIFPVEPHGFREPSSWLDEYRRIFKLFETHLHP